MCKYKYFHSFGNADVLLTLGKPLYTYITLDWS